MSAIKMIAIRPIKYLLALIMLMFSSHAFADEISPKPNQNDLYIIFDLSNSMWGELSDKSRKIEAARQAFKTLQMDDTRQIALRLYGHRQKSDCGDTQLVVPFAPASENLVKMTKVLADEQPLGKTPIALSLQKARSDMQGRTGEVLLVSDGIDSCGMDPCAETKSWAEQGLSLKVHVVGVGLDQPATNAMKCIADTTGGTYLEAQDADEFSTQLSTASSNRKPVISTRTFVHIFAEGGDKRLVRDVIAMQNGKDISTIHYAGGADLPAGIYDLEVRNSFTPFFVENISVDPITSQVLTYKIPVGWVQFTYAFTTEPRTNSRVGRMIRIDDAGRTMPGKMKIREGERIALVPGNYQLVNWLPKGNFPDINFTIELNKTKHLTMQEQ